MYVIMYYVMCICVFRSMKWETRNFIEVVLFGGTVLLLLFLFIFFLFINALQHKCWRSVGLLVLQPVLSLEQICMASKLWQPILMYSLLISLITKPGRRISCHVIGPCITSEWFPNTRYFAHRILHILRMMYPVSTTGDQLVLCVMPCD